ncbi:MAG: DUF7146 domain-containing protein [Henriciella sp.]
MLNSSPRALTAELKGKWYGSYGLAFCPAHENTRTPALAIGIGKEGQALLFCHGGCEFKDIAAALQGRPDAREIVPSQTHQSSSDSRQLIARAVWDTADPVHGSLAERYLSSRGIDHLYPDSLRFHPKCHHSSGRRLPALIAKIDGATGFAIHRTYLAPDGTGKAQVSPNKMMLGQCRGGAARLSRGDGPLVVAEGIETTLSLGCGLLQGAPRLWAALSASGIRSLRLPSRPATLIVAPDGDKAGQDAGTKLAERAHRLGWNVQWHPAPPGKDWNDVLLGKVEF